MRLASNLRTGSSPSGTAWLATEAVQVPAVGGINTIITSRVLNLLRVDRPAQGEGRRGGRRDDHVLRPEPALDLSAQRPKSLRREYTLFFALNGTGLLIQSWSFRPIRHVLAGPTAPTGWRFNIAKRARHRHRDGVPLLDVPDVRLPHRRRLRMTHRRRSGICPSWRPRSRPSRHALTDVAVAPGRATRTTTSSTLDELEPPPGRRAEPDAERRRRGDQAGVVSISSTRA